jgi:hypothetical protein
MLSALFLLKIALLTEAWELKLQSPWCSNTSFTRRTWVDLDPTDSQWWFTLRMLGGDWQTDISQKHRGKSCFPGTTLASLDSPSQFPLLILLGICRQTSPGAFTLHCLPIGVQSSKSLRKINTQRNLGPRGQRFSFAS